MIRSHDQETAVSILVALYDQTRRTQIEEYRTCPHDRLATGRTNDQTGKDTNRNQERLTHGNKTNILLTMHNIHQYAMICE